MRKTRILLVMLFLCGCSKNDHPSTASETAKPLARSSASLVGCYSVTKTNPTLAQIQITPQMAMQMKEPTGGWDTPEAMNTLTADKAWTFFADNPIGVRAKDIKNALGRPDNVMAIAVLDNSATLNPQVDSPFIINIFGTVNTVYQVPCDETPVNFHSSTGAYVISHGGSK